MKIRNPLAMNQSGSVSTTLADGERSAGRQPASMAVIRS